MLNHWKKGALAVAVLPLALTISGCGTIGMGHEGFVAAKHGDWETARMEFNKDYANHPEHPIAVFNMGDTYHHDGDIQSADAKFSHAVEIGKKYEPDDFLEPAGPHATIAEVACRHLHEDSKLDAGCGDQIAVIVPAAPVQQTVAEAAPAPQPAPAVEAQATAVPEPTPAKQDRH